MERGFKLRRCIVRYRAFQYGTWGNYSYVEVLEPGRVASLTGLPVFTKYEIRVAAATNITGNYSPAKHVTTFEGGKRRMTV